MFKCVSLLYLSTQLWMSCILVFPYIECFNKVFQSTLNNRVLDASSTCLFLSTIGMDKLYRLPDSLEFKLKASAWQSPQ